MPVSVRYIVYVNPKLISKEIEIFVIINSLYTVMVKWILNVLKKVWGQMHIT